jgi:hypothetical protein
MDARLAALAEAMPVPAGTARARIAAGLGDRERAIELLERARTHGMVRTAAGNDMHCDPLYDPLRDDPRFQSISRGD